ncbi:trypsin-like peptidase domain-containing protein [Candidatus Saccharibacteria bacterium]|nr:trypsin-like peptidase domain-containing protein [Candidatus Saccharibacteria bacterium]
MKATEKDSNKKQTNTTKKYVYILIACLASLFLLVSFWVTATGKLSFLFDLIKSNIQTEEVELKHTNSLTVKSDGVYVTDVSEVVDEVMPSIVAITSKTVINSGAFGPFYSNRSYTTEGAGSGVIISEDDDEIFILTNYHVVENSSELSVKFIDDESSDASIKGVSERKDIAVVSVSKKNLKSDTLKQIKIATIGDSNELKVGNGIIAIGNALGYGQSVTTGVVSALNREVSTDEYVQDMIQIDAAINGGNSGGALLNNKGEVVGINSVKYSSSASSSSASIEGMGFAIPISDVEDIIKTLIKGENDTNALALGIEGYMTNSGNIASYKLPEGFYLSAITSGGNADKSDLEIGNIITEIDGNKVTSLETIKKVLNKKQKGDKVTLKVKYASRNEYKEKEITITLN